jgi:predicted nucleic acid-binding OB-fold protein
MTQLGHDMGRESPYVLRQEKEMTRTTVTPSEQFAIDYLLVVENDREAWDEVTQEARRVDYNMPQLSDSIREQFEQLASQVIENSEEELTEFGTNVLRQILLCLGSSPFDLIAREVIARDKETLGIEA